MSRGLVAGLVLSLAALGAVLVGLLLTRPGPAPAQGELARVLAAQGVAIALDGPVDRLSAMPGRIVVVASSGADKLRVTVSLDLAADQAEARMGEIRAVIDNLFGDRQAPYPGQLSNTLQCPERYKPEELPRGTWAASVIGLYANDRLAYGGCSEDLLRYHATHALFYDEGSRRLYQVEYFADLANPEDRGLAVVGSFSRLEAP